MKSALVIIVCFICNIGYSQSYKMVGNELMFEEKVQFKNGTAELSPTDQKALVGLKDFLNEKKYVSTLRIEGHVGESSPNSQALSEKRAIAISKWLVAQGIDCKRIIAVGFGNTKPISTSNETSNNTRIVFAIAALREKLIGGMPADGGGQIGGDPCKISK